MLTRKKKSCENLEKGFFPQILKKHGHITYDKQQLKSESNLCIRFRDIYSLISNGVNESTTYQFILKIISRTLYVVLGRDTTVKVCSYGYRKY